MDVLDRWLAWFDRWRKWLFVFGFAMNGAVAVTSLYHGWLLLCAVGILMCWVSVRSARSYPHRP